MHNVCNQRLPGAIRVHRIRFASPGLRWLGGSLGPSARSPTRLGRGMLLSHFLPPRRLRLLDPPRLRRLALSKHSHTFFYKLTIVCIYCLCHKLSYFVYCLYFYFYFHHFTWYNPENWLQDFKWTTYLFTYLLSYKATTVSSVVSEISELCLINKYRNYLYSSEYQFGFKNTSCSSDIYAVQSVVDFHVEQR